MRSSSDRRTTKAKLRRQVSAMRDALGDWTGQLDILAEALDHATIPMSPQEIEAAVVLIPEIIETVARLDRAVRCLTQAMAHSLGLEEILEDA